jgi:NADPH-dependent 2,4-dienoyl-CoA reductase/sulfur reductase-like enzyme
MELALLHHHARGKPHDRLAPRSHPDSGMTRGDSQPVEIGGGLVGLAFGLALRRRDVPVTAFEAHDYPRHRFGRRLAAASLLHPYLLDQCRQRWPVLTSRMRLVPFRPLYHLTH